MAKQKFPDRTTEDKSKDELPACCPPVTKAKSGGRKRSCLEGCLFALCCCWLWEACCDL
ncbi:hypothetical protein ES319_A05G292700v1 [Gossypium barbadense]|uniref:Uncharacterized protein n=2 Tax=Gossypium TaxID=3633 RepID=A0A5J5VW51_GOSBA|nr:hypothetical protein ES319_A05G292700v1 [Gossypium barbadense]TYH18839.1 hypothetical protein ES288_A05G305500v1 [Gossypium darwinii]